MEHLSRNILQQSNNVLAVAYLLQGLILSEDVLHRHRTDDVLSLQQMHYFRLSFKKRLIFRVQSVGHLQHIPIGAIRLEDGIFDQSENRDCLFVIWYCIIESVRATVINDGNKVQFKKVK